MSLEKFASEYYKQLQLARATHPDMYAWPSSEIDSVFNRMKSGIERGSFHKDSHAIRWTCKALGIDHTYKAIKLYIEREDIT